ncbi:hypothetical protein G9X64_30660 [Rhizobium sophorae]|uniref:Uncharacterized protein n=1 Tax=Rhizobium sophorae TaxID=1535242 RepID=A0A7Y3WI16_9HYPH|nr:hypothetical protein [Rhizobium sophorae]NNU40769.1 hypothetical protein [Rhizobium sophorae]
MIDPLTARPETPERKVELDQTVDFAIQLLVEEAHLVGWTDRNLQRHHIGGVAGWLAEMFMKSNLVKRSSIHVGRRFLRTKGAIRANRRYSGLA